MGLKLADATRMHHLRDGDKFKVLGSIGRMARACDPNPVVDPTLWHWFSPDGAFPGICAHCGVTKLHHADC